MTKSAGSRQVGLALAVDCAKMDEMHNALSSTSRRLLWALRWLALVVIALHLAAPLFLESTVWGLWPMTYLPVLVRWLLACTAAFAALFGEALWQRLGRARSAWRSIRWSAPATRLAITLLAGAAFYLLRIRHVRWGDAKLLVKALDDPYRLTYVWQAPLDVFVHAKGYQLGSRFFGWSDPVPVYTILSVLAGMLFVWVLLGLAIRLGRNRAERALLAGLVLTLGTMQLFFGYIENYPIMTLGVLAYLALAVRYLEGEIALAWSATALAITHAFHPSTIILAPTLLYLALAQPGQASLAGLYPAADRAARLRHALLSIAIPYGVVFAGIVALMTAGGHGLDALAGVDFPGGGDRSWFVPLFNITTKWQHYTMFSLGHLLDIVNQQLLVAPVVWPALILVAVIAGRRIAAGEPIGRFLGLAAVSYLLLTLVWNPDYGGQKDWDLFSPAAVPVALLLGWVLPRALPDPRALRSAGWALLAAQAAHTIAWIWQNTLPQ